MQSDYIFDVTEILGIPSQSERVFRSLADGLSKVQRKDRNIKELGVIGGAVVDLLLGINPRDIDIRYSYEIDGELTTICKCDHIRDLVESGFGSSLREYDIDLENILEMEPYLSLREKHLGLLSQHTDYISMFMLDAEGRIWANRDSVKYFQEKIFEVRFEGWLMWLAFRDIRNYYRIFAGAMTRGLSYVDRKKLNVGEKFRLSLEYLPFVLEELVKLSEEHASYRKLFVSKIGDVSKLRDILDRISIKEGERICTQVEKIITIT